MQIESKQVSADADRPARDALPHVSRTVPRGGRSVHYDKLTTDDRHQFITLSVHLSWQHFWRSTCSCKIFMKCPELGTKFQKEVPLFLKIPEFLYNTDLWRTDRQTDGHMTTVCSALAQRRAVRIDELKSSLSRSHRPLCGCYLFTVSNSGLLFIVRTHRYAHSRPTAGPQRSR